MGPAKVGVGLVGGMIRRKRAGLHGFPFTPCPAWDRDMLVGAWLVGGVAKGKGWGLGGLQAKEGCGRGKGAGSGAWNWGEPLSPSTQVSFQHETYPAGAEAGAGGPRGAPEAEEQPAGRQVLLVQELEVRDRLASSQINKFLYLYTSERMPRRAHANMVGPAGLGRRGELGPRAGG